METAIDWFDIILASELVIGGALACYGAWMICREFKDRRKHER